MSEDQYEPFHKSPLKHTIMWEPNQKIYQCCIGFCLWSCTEQELEKVGYTIRHEGCIFVDASDFDVK